MNNIQDLEGEIWKDIPNISNYQISNLGRVRSLINNRQNLRDIPKILKQRRNSNGYIHVALFVNKKVKRFFVHRLVAITFIPNLENLPCVHHIDDDKQNNNSRNLIWTTIANNNRKQRNRKHKGLKPKQIRPKEIVPNYYTDKTFSPIDEVWINMKYYEKYYKISNYGRVLSFVKNYKNGPKLLQPRLHKCRNAKCPLSYCLIGKKVITVHKLVALNFISNTNNYKEINHIDSNKHNNHISNLEWTTHEENIKHAVKNNLNYKGEKNYLSKLKEKDIIQIRKLYEEEKFSLNKLSRIFNVGINNISCVVKRKTWKHI